MSELSMNVVGLRIKNFLSITDLQLKPGHITQICGANSTGKTSILRALEFAMKGSSDGSLVKHGETQAEIIVEFSDGLNVRRRVNSSGTQDVRVSKNEMEAKSPQNLLSSLFETSAFNPLELLEPKRRTEALLQAVPVSLTEAQVAEALSPLPENIALPPVDYSVHGLRVATSLYDYFYNRRAEANKVVKAESARLGVEAEKLSAIEPARGLSVDAELDRMIGECDAEIRNVQRRAVEKEHHQREHDNIHKRIAQEEAVIRNLEIQIAAGKAKLLEFSVTAQHLQQRIAEFGDPTPRLSELNSYKSDHAAEKLKNSIHRNWVAQKDNLEGQARRLTKAQQVADDLDRAVSTIRGPLKESMMQSVQMPIPGITFVEDKFFFEGFAIENLSTSASIKLACALARALSKKAKVICIDGCEALDEDNYTLLKKEIEGDGYTYFLTTVGEPFKDSAGDQVVMMPAGTVL